MENNVTNPTLEIIYKCVSEKCWEQEVPLMLSPLVENQPDSTSPLGKMKPFQIHHFTLLA